MNGWLLTATMLVLILWPIHFAAADEKNEVKKRLDEIEETEEKKDKLDEEISVSLPYIEKVTVNGFIEFNYDYIDTEDTGDKDSGSSSDLYISSIELALRFFFSKWAKAKVVVNIEDAFKDDDDEGFNLDEALLTLKAPWVPLYFVGGKTVLPFGVFGRFSKNSIYFGTMKVSMFSEQYFNTCLSVNLSSGARTIYALIA